MAVTPNSVSSTSGMSIELLVVGLVLAVALRSYVWVGLQSGVVGYGQLALSIALAAGLGKLIGGFLTDRLGWRTYVIIALVMSTLLLAFRGETLWLLLAGIFFLQSITPLSLAALGLLMPSSPALAASLVLGVGVLLGGLLFALVGSNWLSDPPGIILILFASAGLYWCALRGLGKSKTVHI
jgi:FSR family fosmidomycin resistance protein-like MFS transporter